MKELCTIILFFFIVLIANAQEVYIPDPAFKKELLANPGINTNGDNAIQVSEAALYSGTIDVRGLGISDLTGIEAFTGIKGLICAKNNLTGLNVSANKGMAKLNCSFNRLTSLNISITALVYLDCYNNSLSNLNIASDTALSYLSCYSNDLTSLDVSSNKELSNLWCYSNKLTSLDLSSNIFLKSLACQFNYLTSLNVSSNKALYYLSCNNNNLTGLDLSLNATLSTLYCNNNNLKILNVRNGNNHKMTENKFNAKDNANLNCIEVDNDIYSSGSWTNTDAWAHFSNDCGYTSINAITSDNDVNINLNVETSELTVENRRKKMVSIKIYNILGKIVKSQNLSENKATVDMKTVPRGVYFIKITDAGKYNIYRKLIK